MSDRDEVKPFNEVVDSFIESNSHLVTGLGIFGAIGVYLSTIARETPEQLSSLTINLGIASSLLIFIGIALVLLINYLKHIKEAYGPLLLVSRSTVLPFIALILFLSLISSVMVIVTSYNNILSGLLEAGVAVVMLFAGLVITVRSALWIDSQFSERKCSLKTTMMITGLLLILFSLFVREIVMVATINNAVLGYDIRITALAIASGGFVAVMWAWRSDEI